MEIIETILQAIVTGNARAADQSAQEALEAGIFAEQVLNDALIPAMAEVGRLYEIGEYFVPEMLIAARAMKTVLARLKPYLVDARVKPVAKVAIATVQGDLHDIGKNLVSLMLEGAGFEIVDMGVNTPPEKFVEAVRTQNVQLVGMSALLTTTMSQMKATIQALVDAGLRDRVRVMVGGAPITQAFADEIGADGYAPDASRAVSLAKKLIAVA